MTFSVTPEAPTMSPTSTDQREHPTALLLHRVLGVYDSTDATPDLNEALRQVAHAAIAEGDPAGAGQHLLDAIDVKECTALNGLCIDHENDWGEIIHRGPETAMTVGEQKGLLPFRLAKWGNDKPCIIYGAEGDDLDLAATDAAIDAEREHLAALVQARAQLATALQSGQVTA